jgi:hypothetical protein
MLNYLNLFFFNNIYIIFSLMALIFGIFLDKRFIKKNKIIILFFILLLPFIMYIFNKMYIYTFIKDIF